MTTILLVALKEIFLALIAKIAFKAIAERFATRLVIHGLKKLEQYSDNEVVDGTCEDLIESLQGKRLHVADTFKNK